MAYFDNLYASSNKSSPQVSNKGGYFGDIYSQPSKFQTTSAPQISAGSQAQQNSGQIKVGNLTINTPFGGIGEWASGVKDKLVKTFMPERPKIEPVKLPDGFQLKIVEPKAIERFDLTSKTSGSAKLSAPAQKKVMETQQKISKKVDDIGSSLNTFLTTEGKRIQRDFNSLVSGGVVSNKNQVAPREEYMSEAAYQSAIDRSKQKTVLDRANKYVADLAAGVGTTLTLGKLAPDQAIVDKMDKDEQIFYTAGQLLPLAKVPIATLAKFLAVDFAFNTAFTAVTGKEKPSDLLPEGTSPFITNTVDVLEFLGKAYVAHGIKPGKIRDVFTKTTQEKYNLPKEVNISSAQLRDIHQTGKLTTAQEKQLITSLQLTSKEYANLIRGKKDVTIKVPAETVIQMVDRAWWAKVKGAIGKSNSKPVVINTIRAGEVAQTPKIAGLLPAGEYTPAEIQSAVIGSALENTPAGKALIKTSIEAQNRGQNISIVPPEIRNANKALNQANTKKIVDQTVAGEREQYRLDSPQSIAKYANVEALGTTNPEDTVKVFRWTKEGGAIEPGQYVGLIEEALDKYKLRNPDPSFKVVTSEVPLKDLVGGGGLRVEAIYAPKNAIAPAPISAPATAQVPTEVKPKIEQEPKPRFVPTIGVPKLAQGVRRNAIKNKLTYGFDKTFQNLPEYDRVNVKDQRIKATELILNDPEKAFRIAMGKENPPGDILPESVFVAMEKYAIETRDVNLMRELATRSELTSTATGMGQRIRMLAERDTDSPVKAIRDVQDARQKAIEKKSKGTVKEATQKVVKQIKEKIKKPDKNDWNSFIDSIQC